MPDLPHELEKTRRPRAPQPDGRTTSLRALAFFGRDAPLELRLVGRTLLHAGAVGIAAGVLGAAFFAALELGQRLLLGGLAGFEPLRARGETFLGAGPALVLEPAILVLVPALGALASGVLTSVFAPEAAGGGGDAAIDAYHHGGVIRRRVIAVKGLAATFALSAGGAGGREGPTMHIGAAIGAAVSRVLPTTRPERRVLLIAGIAAGISAVFRTLRNHSLYPAQVTSRAASPAHQVGRARASLPAENDLRELLVAPIVAPIPESSPLSAVVKATELAGQQRVIALVGPAGFSGLVELAIVQVTPESERHWMKAADARVPFVSLAEDASWGEVADALDRCGVSQVPLVRDGEIVGWVGDRELRRAVLAGAAVAPPAG